MRALEQPRFQSDLSLTSTLTFSFSPSSFSVLITNGEFTSFSFGADTPQDHTQVVVSSSNAGAVSFVNSAFWGPSHKIASSSGAASSSLSFDSCIFNERVAR